jgi:signal transduction histidine kinase
MIAVSILAICAATVFLYIRFDNENTQFREGTLRSYVRLLARALQAGDAIDPPRIPSSVTRDIQENGGRYAVVTEAGAVVAASPGLTVPLVSLGKHPVEYFSLNSGNKPEFGLSVKRDEIDPPLWIQVAFSENSIVFDSVLEEFVQDIAWIWIPFVGVLLLVNVGIARIALRPLRVSAQYAEMIGPSSVSVRLPETGLPGDVLALVHAVNLALDRLQDGFRIQEEFVSDAAHELRTPLAVVRARLSSADGPLVENLRRDISTMERLVNQLLDRARLGGMHIEPGDRADLSEIAREVAEHIAPITLAKGRMIEIIGAERPIIINGAYDFLFRALRNLVENAVEHTPYATTVTIVVKDTPAIDVMDHGPGIPVDQRQNIVKRFWQGRRDRSEGAGIGLAIVQQTMAGHRGFLRISDAPGGGASFSMIFPNLTA